MSPETVRVAFTPRQFFFNYYMMNVSGPLDKATALPESDKEFGGDNSIHEVLHELPQDVAETSVESVVGESIADDVVDFEVEGNLPASILHGLTHRSETTTRLCSTFLPCQVGTLSKMLLSALHGKDNLRERLFGAAVSKEVQHLEIWELLIETFAWMIHLRVRDTYWRSTEEDLLAYPFPYAGLQMEYTLKDLMADMDNCRNFLLRLWGASSQYTCA